MAFMSLTVLLPLSFCCVAQLCFWFTMRHSVAGLQNVSPCNTNMFTDDYRCGIENANLSPVLVTGSEPTPIPLSGICTKGSILNVFFLPVVNS